MAKFDKFAARRQAPPQTAIKDEATLKAEWPEGGAPAAVAATRSIAAQDVTCAACRHGGERTHNRETRAVAARALLRVRA